jgi:hypothetical protein
MRQCEPMQWAYQNFPTHQEMPSLWPWRLAPAAAAVENGLRCTVQMIERTCVESLLVHATHDQRTSRVTV